jgi:hypothetical protein
MTCSIRPTDEDAFASDDPSRLLGIRIGEQAESRATYFLQSQPAIKQLIETLLALRPFG